MCGSASANSVYVTYSRKKKLKFTCSIPSALKKVVGVIVKAYYLYRNLRYKKLFASTGDPITKCQKTSKNTQLLRASQKHLFLDASFFYDR
jgi:hypothetical protein